jgi:hypothetical protein
MGTRGTSTTGLTFTVQEDTLVTTLSSANKTEVSFDGVFVKVLPSLTFSINMSNKRPIELLMELKDKFSSILLFSGSESFDTVVKDIAQTFDSGVRQTSVRKAYAKYFYETLVSRNTRSLTRDNSFNETALIVTDLLAWYFIRRAVHIYVVCAIMDKVQNSSLTARESTSTTYIPSNPLSTSVVNMVDDEAKKKSEMLSQQLAKLQQDVTQGGIDKISLQASLSSIEQSKNDLETKVQELQATIVSQFNEITRLRNELNGFKELLLNSTSMIFKIDEVPTLSAT